MDKPLALYPGVWLPKSDETQVVTSSPYDLNGLCDIKIKLTVLTS